MVSRTFQSGKILTYGYDDFDRVTSITDNNGPSATFVYDVMGKMKSKTVTPQGGGTPQVTQYQYDDRDRLIAKTDPTGRATFHDYSIVSVGCHVRDLPTKVTEPGNKVTAMEYDNRQRLIRKTDADNHVTRYEYNPRGDRTDVYSSVPEGTRKWKNKANEAEAKTPGDIASGV
ncbi:MAG: hypothetical protein HY074_00945 [Deltaproteobacteria bacterium]|nr:hypothetical protein [Deltaproteobacteria bacterium]